MSVNHLESSISEEAHLHIRNGWKKYGLVASMIGRDYVLTPLRNASDTTHVQDRELFTVISPL